MYQKKLKKHFKKYYQQYSLGLLAVVIVLVAAVYGKVDGLNKSMTAELMKGSKFTVGKTMTIPDPVGLKVTVIPEGGRYTITDDETGEQVGYAQGSATHRLLDGSYTVDFKEVQGQDAIYGWEIPESQTVMLTGKTPRAEVIGEYKQGGVFCPRVLPMGNPYEVEIYDAKTNMLVRKEAVFRGSFFVDIPFGSYIARFNDVEGFITPEPLSFTLTKSQYRNCSTEVVYEEKAGKGIDVVMNIEGGRFQIHNKRTYQIDVSAKEGSQFIILPNGEYRVEFLMLFGQNTGWKYEEPKSQTVTLTDQSPKAKVTGNYVKTGWVRLGVVPSDIDYKVKFVDPKNHANIIRTADASDEGHVTLPFGRYTAIFNEIKGYETPANIDFELTESAWGKDINVKYSVPSIGIFQKK